MAMSTKSFGRSLEQQRDELEAQIRERDALKLLEERRKMADELPTLVLPCANQQIIAFDKRLADLAEQMRAVELEKKNLVQTRTVAAMKLTARANELKNELITTAPAEIDEQIKSLEAGIEFANGARRTTTGGGSSQGGVRKMSNSRKTDAYVLAAQRAISSLHNLKLKALDSAALAAAIADILGTVPAQEFGLEALPSGPAPAMRLTPVEAYNLGILA